MVTKILQMLIPLMNNISVIPLIPVLVTEKAVSKTVPPIIIRPDIPRN